jgi:hypothetical protein
MMLLTNILKQGKLCLLKSQIRRQERSINSVRNHIVTRNNKFHGGRLEVDEILVSTTEEERLKIYSLKRQIVKNR